jgi:hypothetical protein
MPYTRFRIRTLMIAIAALAVLMGLGASHRINDKSELIEMIKIAASDRPVGLTESRRLWVKVGSAFPNSLTGLFISPRTVVLDCVPLIGGPECAGLRGAVVFYLLPVEYVAAILFGSIAMIAMLVEYLLRLRQCGAGPKRGAGGSVG